MCYILVLVFALAFKLNFKREDRPSCESIERQLQKSRLVEFCMDLTDTAIFSALQTN